MVEKGDSLVLECNFHADKYDMFARPVIWRKVILVNFLLSFLKPIIIFAIINENFDDKFSLKLQLGSGICKFIAGLMFQDLIYL